MIEIEVENRFLTGSVQITKVDEEYPDSKLSGAVFEVYADVDNNHEFDEKADKLAGNSPKPNPGFYRWTVYGMADIFLHEKQAPEFFLPDDHYYYFEIRTDETVLPLRTRPALGLQINQSREFLRLLKQMKQEKSIYRIQASLFIMNLVSK